MCRARRSRRLCRAPSASPAPASAATPSSRSVTPDSADTTTTGPRRRAPRPRRARAAAARSPSAARSPPDPPPTSRRTSSLPLFSLAPLARRPGLGARGSGLDSHRFARSLGSRVLQVACVLGTRCSTSMSPAPSPEPRVPDASLDHALRHHQLRVQNRRAGGAAHDVVGQGHELHVEDRAGAHAADATPSCRRRDRRRGAAAGGSARSSPRWPAPARSAGRVPAGGRGRRASPRPPASTAGAAGELDRHGHGVAVEHRHAVGVRADHAPRAATRPPSPPRIFCVSISIFSSSPPMNGHDVAEDVERRHARIAGAGDRLHRASRPRG